MPDVTPRFVFLRDGVLTNVDIVRLESRKHMWGSEASDELSSYLAGQRVMRNGKDRIQAMENAT